MRISNIAHLYTVRLRTRLVQELLAVTGIAIGVALLLAALVANTSLTASAAQLTDGLVGQARFELVARGPDGFDQRTVRRVERLPGVDGAAPLVEARAILSRGHGHEEPVLLVGGDARLAKLRGPLVRSFASPLLAGLRAIALPAPVAGGIGAALGDRVHVETGAGVTTTSLGARLTAGDIGSLVHSPIAIAPLSYAQRISGLSGRVTRVFVRATAGSEREVEAGLKRLAGGRLDVRPARFDLQLFKQASTPTNQSTSMFAGFAALVGFLFALSAVLLTVPQRRRFITDLRMAGHPPAMVIEVVLIDALVLGAVGSVLGIALGDVLSRHLLGAVPGYLGSAFPVGSQRVVRWSSVALAAAAGIAAACVAVMAPVREIIAVRPVLYGAASPSPRRSATALVAAGLVCMVTSVALVAFAPGAAIAALLCLTAALLLLLPALLRAGIEGMRWCAQFIRSAAPALALMELRSRAPRTRALALAATGAVAVFASVAIDGARRDLLRGLNSSAHQIDASADLWVKFPGNPNTFATTPFAITHSQVRDLAALPGVAAVRVYRGAFLDIGNRRLWVLAPPHSARAPVPTDQVADGEAVVATRRVRQGGWVVLSQAAASMLHVRVGDRFRLPSPVPKPFRVAALSTNLGWPPGAIILNATDFARAWGTKAATALEIAIRPGVPPLSVKHELQRTMTPALPLNVQTSQERQQQHFASSRQGVSRLTGLSRLVLGAALLAVVSAMGGAIWQRRPTLAGLKVDGFTELELWTGLLLESAMLLGTGCLIGAAFGLGGQVLLTRALKAMTGFPVVYSIAVPTAGAILATAIVAGVAVLAIPGFLAVRVRPATGLPARQL